jgi:hypothetical protein
MFEKRNTALIAATSFWMLAATTALSQTNEPYPPVTPDPELPAPEATIPEQTYPCNPGGFEPAEGLEDPAENYAYDCTGVIEPPAGVDAEIKTKPPVPDAGTLKVIPPEEVLPD